MNNFILRHVSAVGRPYVSALRPALCAVALCASLSLSAQNQFEPIQNPYNKEFYEKITYTWTDDRGVSHLSSLADRADSYPQIVELLKEVYANPSVPGFVKDPEAYGVDHPANPNTAVNVQYAPCEYAPYNMTGSVQTPVEGATALLVELRDDYTYNAGATPEEMLQQIKAVCVLTNNLHIGDTDKSENPGWLFNYVGELDKFFIITKGCNRVPNNHPEGVAPFYMMYEEFSPSNKEPIYGAYQSMNGGEQFAVDHNCSSVLSQNHIIGMAQEGKDEDYSMNFMFYLPDRRFAGDSRTSDGTHFYEWYTYYSNDHSPFFFFNKITAAINETPSVDFDSHIAKVQVEWTSTYKEVSKSNVPERFYIHRVVNDAIQPEPLAADEYELHESIASNSIKMDDGTMVSAADKCIILVKEKQGEWAEDVQYIIKGRRYGSDFEFVESNIVKTNIPGYKGTEQLSILIDGTPKSEYNADSQANEYVNNINLTDLPNAHGKRLVASQIIPADPANGVEGSLFTLHKYTADSENTLKVATMTVVKKSAKTWGNPDEGVWVYDAVITYPEGADTEGLELTAQFKSKYNIKHPELDGDEPVIAVDKNAAAHSLARFADRFAASTQNGTHPGEYHYFIAFESEPGVSASKAETQRSISNVVDVTVPVRELKVGYIPYTLDDIEADKDHTALLPLNATGIQFETRSNPNITNYVIRNVTKGVDVVRATRASSGKLTISRADASGKLGKYSEISNSQWVNPVVPLEANATPGDEYSLVLTYNNGNTYGNVHHTLRRAPMPVMWHANLKYDDAANADNAYYTNIDWMPMYVDAPQGASEEEAFVPFGWRVWGKHDTAAEFYAVHDHDNMQDGMDQSSGHVVVESRFNSHEASSQTPVNMQHYARLYAALPESMTLNGTSSKAESTPGFIVSDNMHEMTMTDGNGIVTGIDEVGTEADVTYRYYDVSGRPVPSNALPSGVIIRVASDGTVTKLMR